MVTRRSWTPPRVLALLAALLIVKVTAGIVLNYRNYFPPNFDSDFLQGRDGYFFGTYQWAFYAHLATGPISLLLGTILVSERFRLRFTKWHRRLGRVQGILVLSLLAPSGLWMAFRAQSGWIAIGGFATLALATGVTVAFGWRRAVQKRFADHRRWMWRCFLLLCSAVVLRLTVGLSLVAGIEGTWIDPFVAWASWLGPLTVYELSGPVKRLLRRRMLARSGPFGGGQGQPQSGTQHGTATGPAVGTAP